MADEPKLRTTLQAHTDGVISLAFSPDGKTLASGGADNFIKSWDVADAKYTATLQDAGSHMWCALAFSPDGKLLAWGDKDATLKLWDLPAGAGAGK